PRPSRSTLFPYTTLFRSLAQQAAGVGAARDVDALRAAQKIAGDVHVPGGRDGRIARVGRAVHDAVDGVAGTDDIQLAIGPDSGRSEEHTSELQSLAYLVC